MSITAMIVQFLSGEPLSGKDRFPIALVILRPIPTTVIDAFTLFQPTPSPPSGAATWVELQALAADRAQVAWAAEQAYWARFGAWTQLAAFVAAGFAAWFAKGAYDAAVEQAGIAREQLNQSRRADALTAYHELEAWLVEGKEPRKDDPVWRAWVLAMAPAKMMEEVSKVFRSHTPGSKPAAASIAAGRVGGEVLASFNRAVAAHETLYSARAKMGAAMSQYGYHPPEDVQRELPEAAALTHALEALLDSLVSLEKSASVVAT